MILTVVSGCCWGPAGFNGMLMCKKKRKLDLESKSKSSTSGWWIQIYACVLFCIYLKSNMNHTTQKCSVAFFYSLLVAGEIRMEIQRDFFVVATQQRSQLPPIILPRWQIWGDLELRRLHMGASFVDAFIIFGWYFIHNLSSRLINLYLQS